MATDWITAVGYHAGPKHIDYAIWREMRDGVLGYPALKTRAEVAAAIRQRHRVYTATVIASKTNFQKGAEVVIDVVNGVEYLTTKPDKSERDNLGKLPCF